METLMMDTLRFGKLAWGLCVVCFLAQVLRPAALFAASQSQATTRIKDIVSFEGVRDNQLVGYGLVIGLNGTGDGLSKSTFTKESLISMLERMGVNTRDIGTIDTRNVAAVMVTSTLPPFARHGTRLDIVVSAMGDSKNLMGGTLLVTPLMAADGEVYAVAQGPIATSGVAARGQGQSVTKGVPTSGRIANGAIVEREVGFELAQQGSMRLSLRNPDFTTALRICEVINSESHHAIAKALDSGTVQVKIPESYNNDIVTFLTKIEQLGVVPDQPARIIVDDHDGVIVMGENIRISRVAVSHGSLVVKVNETPQVSQPSPLTSGVAPSILGLQNATLLAQGQNLSAGQSLGSVLAPNFLTQPATPSTTTPSTTTAPSTTTTTGTTTSTTTAPINLASLQGNTQNLLGAQGAGGARTVTVPRTEIDIKDGAGAKMKVVDSGASIHDLVNSLNALGASPRDMITILQSIKAAGALQASIEVI